MASCCMDRSLVAALPQQLPFEVGPCKYQEHARKFDMSCAALRRLKAKSPNDEQHIMWQAAPALSMKPRFAWFTLKLNITADAQHTAGR